MPKNNNGLSPAEEMEHFSNSKKKKQTSFTNFIRDSYYNISYHAKAATSNPLTLNLILTTDAKGR
jgi:hypothetical protein